MPRISRTQSTRFLHAARCCPLRRTPFPRTPHTSRFHPYAYCLICIDIYYCYPSARARRLSTYLDWETDFDFVNAAFFLRVIHPRAVISDGLCRLFRSFAPFFPAFLKNSAVYIFVIRTSYHATPNQQSTPFNGKKKPPPYSDDGMRYHRQRVERAGTTAQIAWAY